MPYDGSGPSKRALKHAVQMPHSVGKSSEITLLHVVEKIILPHSFSHNSVRSPKTGELIDRDAMLKEVYHSLRQRAQTMLENAIQSVESRHLTLRAKVRYGNPSECILEFAKNYKVDLIVIGNIGLSGIAKLKALGSVSRSVSERAPCPVLIVH